MSSCVCQRMFCNVFYLGFYSREKFLPLIKLSICYINYAAELTKMLSLSLKILFRRYTVIYLLVNMYSPYDRFYYSCRPCVIATITSQFVLFGMIRHDVQVFISEGIRKKTRKRTEETEKEYCVTLR